MKNLRFIRNSEAMCNPHWNRMYGVLCHCQTWFLPKNFILWRQRTVPSTHLAKWWITINTKYIEKVMAIQNVHVCSNKLLVRQKKNIHRKWLRKKRNCWAVAKWIRKWMKVNGAAGKKSKWTISMGENTFEEKKYLDHSVHMQESWGKIWWTRIWRKSENNPTWKKILTKKKKIWSNYFNFRWKRTNMFMAKVKIDGKNSLCEFIQRP